MLSVLNPSYDDTHDITVTSSGRVQSNIMDAPTWPNMAQCGGNIKCICSWPLETFFFVIFGLISSLFLSCRGRFISIKSVMMTMYELEWPVMFGPVEGAWSALCCLLCNRPSERLCVSLSVTWTVRLLDQVMFLNPGSTTQSWWGWGWGWDLPARSLMDQAWVAAHMQFSLWHSHAFYCSFAL